MDKIFVTIVDMSITASIVILLVLIFRFFLKKTPKIVLHYKKPAFWISIVAILCVSILGIGLIANPKHGKVSEINTVINEEADYQALLKLFPTPHELPSKEPIVVDLNGDGIDETITLKYLEEDVQGGDGGYRFVVKSGESELTLPNDYSEVGFPFRVEWDGSELKVVINDWEYVVPENLVNTIYSNIDASDVLETHKDKIETIIADPVSGVAIKYEGTNKQPILVIKQFLNGPGGHWACIGYGITEMTLNTDNTWDKPVHYYLPSN
ncbi:hypothetical protein [Anaerosporobacter sp.]